MLTRRSVILSIAAASAAATALPVHAVEKAFYTQKAFEEAQRAGRPILVDVWASWCPTCKAQQAVLEKLAGNAKFKDLVVLSMDFDVQKDALKFFGARQQSTLIVFKGAREVARSVGDTKPTSIEAMILKAL